MDEFQIYFHPARRPVNFPEVFALALPHGSSIMAGIVIGTVMLQHPDDPSLIDDIESRNDEGNWESINSEDFLYPHLIRRCNISMAFCHDEMRSPLTKAEAWRYHLNWLRPQHNLDSIPFTQPYTTQICNHPASPERRCYFIQFTQPEFIQGLLTVFNWSGVDWHEYLGPIFHRLTEEVEIA
jgi:hypothetical protein